MPNFSIRGEGEDAATHDAILSFNSKEFGEIFSRRLRSDVKRFICAVFTAFFPRFETAWLKGIRQVRLRGKALHAIIVLQIIVR